MLLINYVFVPRFYRCCSEVLPIRLRVDYASFTSRLRVVYVFDSRLIADFMRFLYGGGDDYTPGTVFFVLLDVVLFYQLVD